MTTLALGLIAVLLGIAFEKQNIAFMVSLAFAIAASANFPVLFLSVLWKDCTTRGAVIGGFLGLASSVALTVVSPSVWEATLGNPKGRHCSPHLARAVLHGDWIRRHLAVLDHRQECQRGPRARRLRGAAGALGNRLRRCGCLGTLTGNGAQAAWSPWSTFHDRALRPVLFRCSAQAPQ